MKLYVYDYCPYCVKARMIFGLKKIDFNLEVVLYNEEELLIHLVGQKMVPILIKDDGEAMCESMDIIHFIDHLNKKPILTGEKNPEIEKWLTKVSKSFLGLTIPYATYGVFPEFATQAAVDYYTSKKQNFLGETFDAMRKKRNEYIHAIHIHFQDLAPLIQSKEAINGILSTDDFHVYAILRNLSLFKDIVYPEKIKDYMINMSKLSNVSLLCERSI